MPQKDRNNESANEQSERTDAVNEGHCKRIGLKEHGSANKTRSCFSSIQINQSESSADEKNLFFVLEIVSVQRVRKVPPRG